MRAPARDTGVRCPWCHQLYDRELIEHHIGARHGNDPRFGEPIYLIALVVLLVVIVLIVGAFAIAYQREVLAR